MNWDRKKTVLEVFSIGLSLVVSIVALFAYGKIDDRVKAWELTQKEQPHAEIEASLSAVSENARSVEESATEGLFSFEYRIKNVGESSFDLSEVAIVLFQAPRRALHQGYLHVDAAACDSQLGKVEPGKPWILLDRPVRYAWGDNSKERQSVFGETALRTMASSGKRLAGSEGYADKLLVVGPVDSLIAAKLCVWYAASNHNGPSKTPEKVASRTSTMYLAPIKKH